MRIDNPEIDVPATADRVRRIIQEYTVSNLSVIVAGTKTLHQPLDLVPPVDRKWTGAFFLWSATAPQHAQASTFTRTFTGFSAQRRPPAGRVRGPRLANLNYKGLDNAIIGYCKSP